MCFLDWEGKNDYIQKSNIPNSVHRPHYIGILMQVAGVKRNEHKNQ